jgi:hypothetical protein
MDEDVIDGFWSYAHADNDRDGGRVTKLAALIAGEYALLTGRTINIFVDSVNIKWGDQWRDRISDALQQGAFFIPIITPTYFTRDICRNEMIEFTNAAKALGLEELILPILYIPVADLDVASTDTTKALVAKTQYETWSDLRLADEASAAYRTGVNRIAQRLVELQDLIENKPLTEPGKVLAETGLAPAQAADGSDSNDDPDLDDEAPGLLDLMGGFEGSAGAFQATLNTFPVLINDFSSLLQKATSDLNEANSQPNAAAAKLTIARRLAAELEEPIELIQANSKAYAENLIDLDPRVRAFVSMAGMTQHDEDAAAATDALDSIARVADAGSQTAASLRTAADAAKSQMHLSRDLRKPFRAFETAIRSVADGQAILDEWRRLADEQRAKFAAGSGSSRTSSDHD